MKAVFRLDSEIKALRGKNFFSNIRFRLLRNPEISSTER
jgi:hypothetical protein